MRTVTLPALGMPLSDYCLGTMYFGSKVDLKTSLRLMDLYAAHGGNFLDSANKYASWVPGFQGGESEQVVGRWLKDHPRDRYIITSKVGFPYGDIPRSLAAKYIISECEKSLTRLGTDYIDIYFAHTQDPDTPIEESLKAFDSLIQSGKIRAIGASNFDAWPLAEAGCAARQHALPAFSVLQQRYSCLQPVLGADFGTQKVLTPEQIDYCARRELLVMAYSPLLGGLYEHADEPLPIQYDSALNRNRLRVLRESASEYGCTPSQLVLSWMAFSSPVIVPLVTASREEHLLDNLKQVPEAQVREFAERLDSLDRFTIKYS